MTRSLSLSNGIRRVYGAFTQKDGREKLDVTSYLLTSLFQTYKIEVRASIERGLADAAAGRTTSQEDIEKLFGVTR